MRRQVLSAAALLTAFPASAQDWNVAGISGNTIRYFDRQSIRSPSPTTREVDVVDVYSFRQGTGAGAHDRLEQRHSIDCTGRTSQTVRAALMLDAKTVFEKTANFQRSPIDAATMFGGIATAVCTSNFANYLSTGTTPLIDARDRFKLSGYLNSTGSRWEMLGTAGTGPGRIAMFVKWQGIGIEGGGSNSVSLMSVAAEPGKYAKRTHYVARVICFHRQIEYRIGVGYLADGTSTGEFIPKSGSLNPPAGSLLGLVLDRVCTTPPRAGRDYPGTAEQTAAIAFNP